MADKSRDSCHLLDVLKAFNFYNSEAGNVQVSCPIRVDLYVQFLPVFTQKVSEK